MDDKLTREKVAALIRSRQISREIGLKADADIKTICQQAGISRKTGYQWAEKYFESSNSNENQLEQRLKQLEEEHEALKKELADVRFENEGRKLSWEIHKVDEYLAGKKNTTTSRKRKKSVSFHRKQGQPMRRSAWALYLSVSTLSGWDKIFDENMCPYNIPEKRGKACKVTVELVSQIVEKARLCKDRKERIRLKGFANELAKDGVILSSKTVSEILTANGLRQPSTRKRRPRFYQSLRRQIPNGLLSFDGGEFTIFIDDDPMTLNLELGVDVGTFTHTAFSIGKTETSAGVLDVLRTHIMNWGCPLGVVCDHGSANMSDVIKTHIDELGIQFLPAGPGNPKGNGTLEGAFSQMKRIIGAIHLDMSSLEALAKSVLNAIVAVYIKMRNKLALQRKNDSPADNFKKVVGQDMVEFERRHLKKHKEFKNRKSDDQIKIERIRFLIETKKIPCEPLALERAEKTIISYDTQAIIESEKAFIKAMNRKPERLSLPYFFGILKNIQQQKDDDAYQDYCRKRYNYQQMLENERRLKPPKEKPATVEQILNMLEISINSPLSAIRKSGLNRAREWTAELAKSHRYLGSVQKRFVEAISELKHIGSHKKEQMWEYLQQFLNPESGGECVT